MSNYIFKVGEYYLYKGDPIPPVDNQLHTALEVCGIAAVFFLGYLLGENHSPKKKDSCSEKYVCNTENPNGENSAVNGAFSSTQACSPIPEMSEPNANSEKYVCVTENPIGSHTLSIFGHDGENSAVNGAFSSTQACSQIFGMSEPNASSEKFVCVKGYASHFNNYDELNSGFRELLERDHLNSSQGSNSSSYTVVLTPLNDDVGKTINNADQLIPNASAVSSSDNELSTNSSIVGGSESSIQGISYLTGLFKPSSPCGEPLRQTKIHHELKSKTVSKEDKQSPTNSPYDTVSVSSNQDEEPQARPIKRSDVETRSFSSGTVSTCSGASTASTAKSTHDDGSVVIIRNYFYTDSNK